MLPKCECRECNERTATCHGTCEKYAKFKKDLEELNRIKDAYRTEKLLNIREAKSLRREQYSAHFFKRWRGDD